MKEKYYITFVDTENISYDAISGIEEIQKMYKDHKDAGVYCYGIEDSKSPNSISWKEKTEKLPRVRWVKVKGPREKDAVDERIKLAINTILSNPYNACIDVWIIATSDGGFLPVINKIKEQGNNIVIGIGSSKPSEKLVKACDDYYKYTRD